MTSLVSAVALLFLAMFTPYQVGEFYRGTTQTFARIQAGERTSRFCALFLFNSAMLGICVAAMALLAATIAAGVSSAWGVALGVVALGCAGLGLWAGLGKEKG